MVERIKTVKAPGFCGWVGDDDTIRLNPSPILLDGKLLVPASDALTGNESGDRDFVLVMLTSGPTGLFMAFTPAGAREFAAAILRGCDMAESQLAAKTDAAIAAARKAAP